MGNLQEKVIRFLKKNQLQEEKDGEKIYLLNEN